MKISNVTGVSLPVAVWLASDDYDFSPGSKSISVTSLLKPVRQILLRERLTPEDRKTPDITDFIASRLGHSIHDGIERAWVNNYPKAMKLLGYSDDVIDRVRINPTVEEVRASNSIIPIWFEQRAERDILGYTLSGKFDLVIDGELHDFKSTSVYSYILGSKDEDYRLQGSLYRWIHRDKITSDTITIQFFFTDWQRSRARQDPKYPQQRVHEHVVELMSIEETDQWIRGRIKELEAAADLPEDQLPFCSDKDLWRSEPKYKYYANPEKTSGRSTKNFDSLHEANAYKTKQGKGVVITVPGQVKACGYCPAFPICSQKDLYEHA